MCFSINIRNVLKNIGSLGNLNLQKSLERKNCVQNTEYIFLKEDVPGDFVSRFVELAMLASS